MSAIGRDAMLAAIRECVTVVKPGEVLAVRAQPEWTASQIRELQDCVDEWVKWREPGITVLILPGGEFAVAQQKPGVA